MFSMHIEAICIKGYELSLATLIHHFSRFHFQKFNLNLYVIEIHMFFREKQIKPNFCLSILFDSYVEYTLINVSNSYPNVSNSYSMSSYPYSP